MPESVTEGVLRAVMPKQAKMSVVGMSAVCSNKRGLALVQGRESRPMVAGDSGHNTPVFTNRIKAEITEARKTEADS